MTCRIECGPKMAQSINYAAFPSCTTSSNAQPHHNGKKVTSFYGYLGSSSMTKFLKNDPLKKKILENEVIFMNDVLSVEKNYDVVISNFMLIES